MDGLWQQLDEALSWGKATNTSNQIWDKPKSYYSERDKRDVERETELEKENAALLNELAQETIKLAEKANDDKKVGLWKVEGFTEEEQVHVRPKSSVTDVEVRHCAGINETMNIHVHGMCNSLKMEQCTNVRIMCDDVVERVDLDHCQKVELVLGGRNRTLVLSNCHLVLVTASHLMFQGDGVETVRCTQVQMRWSTSRPGRTMTAEELLSAPLDGMLMAPEATMTQYNKEAFTWSTHCRVPDAEKKGAQWELRDTQPEVRQSRVKTQIFPPQQQQGQQPTYERWVEGANERLQQKRAEQYSQGPASLPVSEPPVPEPPAVPEPPPMKQAPKAQAPVVRAAAPPPPKAPAQPSSGPRDLSVGPPIGSGSWLKEEQKPPQSPPVKSGYAWFDYTAVNRDELSFKASERIKLIEPSVDPGWFLGENALGRRGMVPVTHLRLPEHDSTLAFHEVRTAAFDYSAQHPDELTFRAGDEIGIISAAQDKGWFHAALGNKIGFVPETHLNPPK